SARPSVSGITTSVMTRSTRGSPWSSTRSASRALAACSVSNPAPWSIREVMTSAAGSSSTTSSRFEPLSDRSWECGGSGTLETSVIGITGVLFEILHAGQGHHRDRGLQLYSALRRALENPDADVTQALELAPCEQFRRPGRLLFGRWTGPENVSAITNLAHQG